MTRNDRVHDLLLRWEEGRAQGQPPTPEQLCQDCPELLPEVRQRLQQQEDLWASRSEASGEALTPPPPTAVQVSPPDSSGSSGSSAAAAGPRYRRLRFHARGGLGEVYVGFDQELRREVALKRMRRPLAVFAEAQRRFLREAEVTGKLEHPGIVPVYGLVRDDDGLPCYAMRFIQGESLQDAIRRFHEADERPRDPGERRLAFRELLTRFATVCKTIAYVHSRGILHRDLKPANVMLGKYGETLVVDWGLARPVERTAADGDSGEEALRPAPENPAEETRVGQVVGTPAYMSPEQAAGRWDVVGPASDLYSLGASLYALLTGKDPITGNDHAEVLRKVQQGEYPPPRQVKAATPAALEAVCLKAMARKPADRYATALELAEEVEHWLADEPVRAYREPWPARARRWGRRHKPLVAGLTALVLTALVLGGGGTVWLHRYYLELRQGTEALLATSAGLRDAARWQEAEDLLEQAKDRLGSRGPADLRQRVAEARADLQLARRLEDIRLQRVMVTANNVDNRPQTARKYAEEFRQAGLGQEGEDVEAVAARIRSSLVRDHLVAALDDWAAVTIAPPRRDWLLEVARRADAESGRSHLRDPNAWHDPAALAALVGELLRDEARLAKLKPQLLVALSNGLYATNGNPVPLLTAAQGRHRNDFWLNYMLGNALHDLKQWDAAVSYYRAALAVRPEAASVYNNLGNALLSKGQLDDAIREYRTAIDLNPRFALPHFNLGNAWRDKGKLDEATREYRTATVLEPKYAPAHSNLGLALGRSKEHLDEAVREMRVALELNPENAETHCNLGFLLGRQGKLTEALAALREGHQLGSAQPGWRHPSGDWVRQVERLVELDGKLPALLEGKEQPASDAERLELGDFCWRRKRLYAAAVKYYAGAFAHNARLADDLPRQNRYNAACAAALAGCGQGRDAGQLDEGERTRLRRQAAEWLRADLALWAKQAESTDLKAREAVRKALKRWQIDSDLAGIREPDALRKLPEAERDDFRKLWDDVAVLLTKVEAEAK